MNTIGEFDNPLFCEKADIEGGKIVYIPNELFNQKRKHRKKEKWVRLWFYKNRRKSEVDPDKLKIDIDITSKLEYQKGTFYKISQLSEDDLYFDYFYKLKCGLPKDIFKKNNRYKTPIVDARVPPRTKRLVGCNEHVNRVIGKGGGFLVTFE